MISERPFADGRHTAVFVFNELKVDGGRLTQFWLARLRAFDEAGWATHAVLINKDATPAAHGRRAGRRRPVPGRHRAAPLRAARPADPALLVGPAAPGGSIDPRVGDWLDWLTAQIPGAVVFADSPAAYPYLAAMSNPLVARVAGIHLNHLSAPEKDQRPGHGRDDPAVRRAVRRPAGRVRRAGRADRGPGRGPADPVRRGHPHPGHPACGPRPEAPGRDRAAPRAGRPPSGGRRIVSIGPLEASCPPRPRPACGAAGPAGRPRARPGPRRRGRRRGWHCSRSPRTWGWAVASASSLPAPTSTHRSWGRS